MPEHKRQHYVPRCYLRQFSSEASDSAINLYNVTNDRMVRNAAIKGQCAKNYFYGEDLQVEHALQSIEGHFSSLTKKLSSGSTDIRDHEVHLLRQFTFLQYSRTEMAMRRMRMMNENMHRAIYDGRQIDAPDLDISDRSMMLQTMRNYASLHEYVEDLKIVLILNNTRIPFICSDDPSIFTSRFHIQKLKTNNFGLGSSGAIFFFPITPHITVMFYDGSVYAVPDKRGKFTKIDKEKDARALNELQYIKAAENIYFSDWQDKERIRREFLGISHLRPESWCRTTVLVRDGVDERGEYYRLATDEECATAQHTLIQLSSLHPEPRAWISKLKYRQPIRTINDGSAAGHVRKHTWRNREGQELPL